GPEPGGAGPRSPRRRATFVPTLPQPRSLRSAPSALRSRSVRRTRSRGLIIVRAARYYGNKDIRIEEIDEPTAGAGEVLIDVAFCGICGTDLHEYLDGPIFCPTPETPTSWTGETAP